MMEKLKTDDEDKIIKSLLKNPDYVALYNAVKEL
jgi:hypothetical protein